MGYDQDQNVIPFNRSCSLTPANTWYGLAGGTGEKVDGAIFINFSRVLMKDEIKKGSFQISLKTGSWANAYYKTPGTGVGHSGLLTLYDAHVTDTTGFKDNSPMGQYGLLTNESTTVVPEYTNYGLIFYQAGLCVLFNNPALWGGSGAAAAAFSSGTLFNPETAQTVGQALVSSSIENCANAARAAFANIQFNNTTELNSTIYFCRVNHNEFNYSSNPSFTSSSVLVVKNVAGDPSVTYPTAIGLYSADNELMAVGKLSEPLKNRSDTEFTLRVRLDY